VPTADGNVWFKACAPVQDFEPRLSAELSARWPDRVAEVLAHDEERAWILFADAGTRIGDFESRNPPEAWLAVLPEYAELQRGEAAHAQEHLEHRVPDLRLEMLPERYDEILRVEQLLEPDELERLRVFAPRFAELCIELAAHGIPATVQHDDLHMSNVYVREGRMRVLDWGDSSISHPFASLYVTFLFLEDVTKLSPDDRWFPLLRDAYLEPWGGAGLEETFELALRVEAFAHAVAWVRQRDHLPEEDRADFDPHFRESVLARALSALREPR
jgi:hypothetical protein